MTGKVERFDHLVALQRMLAAEAVRIRTLLNFGSGKSCGADSRARLHFDLMNRGADARNEKLFDSLETHRAFSKRDAFHAAHRLIGSEQDVNLALDGNSKWIFQKWILPGVNVSFFRRHGNVFAFRKRGSFRDSHGFSGAGLDAFAREPVGGREAPCATRDDANADAERLGFDQRADFPVLGANVALANVHHARVGVGSASALRRVDRPIGPILHHLWLSSSSRRRQKFSSMSFAEIAIQRRLEMAADHSFQQLTAISNRHPLSIRTALSQRPPVRWRPL